MKLSFRRHLRTEIVRGDAVYLISENGVTALKGAHIEAIAPLLDGTRDLPALLRDLPEGTPAEQITNLVARLTDAGLLTSPGHAQTEAIDEQELGYWDAVGIEPVATTSRRVRLIAIGNVDPEAASLSLRAAGMAVVADIEADFAVVLCDDYLAPGIAEASAELRRENIPFLLAKPVGTRIWIGPIFDHDSGPCWHCLASRLRGNREAEMHVLAALQLQGRVPRRRVALPSLSSMAADLVALESTKWLAGYRHPNQRAVWTLDSRDLTGRHHELRHRPQCECCGDRHLMRALAHRAVPLGPRIKVSTSGGGHRSMPTEEVFERFQHLISPVTGIVKEIERDPRGPRFFNCYSAGPNRALGARGVESLRSAIRAKNGGKGTSPLQAKVGALCEAIERYSGTYHGDEERIRGSFRSFDGQAVHPDACQLYDPRQYEVRRTWNAQHGSFQFVCEPFDDDATMDWTPVWSLTEQRHRLLPTGLLYFGAPTQKGHCPVRADSNGNAAGSSLEDAVLQGMLELVERDAIALWWYNRTRQPAVDLDAFADPWLDELRAVYASLHREVWVLDLTADTHIPTMAAISRRTSGGREDIIFGFGAHLEPRVALQRALTELNQMMPFIVSAGESGEFDRLGEPDASRWWTHATLENQPYLRPAGHERARGPADYAYEPSTDLGEDVRAVQSKLESRGLQVLVLDQTRPDIGLPVVKVIVPGMRHFWARFAPGRLFDVPVQLGRMARPTSYEELNPMPMFL